MINDNNNYEGKVIKQCLERGVVLGSIMWKYMGRVLKVILRICGPWLIYMEIWRIYMEIRKGNMFKKKKKVCVCVCVCVWGGFL